MRIGEDWLSHNNHSVAELAQTIYDEQSFDLMPVLGDALDDAGCDVAAMLLHCRQPAQHVRGCWLIDLLTGRA